VTVIAVATVLAGSVAFAAAPDKTAVRAATAKCKAEIKERARFEETSWLQRHRAVKQCVKDALASQ
jgi:stress-induced morphogen